MDNNSTFGNTSWEIFVYGTYMMVAFFLLAYAFYSLNIRKNALKSLKEEGFLEVQKNETKN